jgi:spore coat polysaccharide biosynthesis protein SpsF (cytidylyltransferase family)
MILGVLQARCSSSRLPNKVLKRLQGKAMLEQQIRRLERCRRIDKMIVATSTDASDEPLATLCRAIGIDCYRGSLDDVLDRFYRAAKRFDPDHVVRLTGDCPLTDPEVVDHIIEFHLAGGYDYASNCLDTCNYPDGLDAEVFSMGALETAWTDAELQSQREHVTLFINRQPGRFKIGLVRYEKDLSFMRWTVDEPEDFEFVSRVYNMLYPSKHDFTMQDILALLEAHPELAAINGHFERNEGLRQSLARDKQTVTVEE